MTPQERTLILDLALRRISEADFLSRFRVNPKSNPSYIKNALETALRQKDPKDVEHAMLLAFRFGFSKEMVTTLCKLILEGWHAQHENIAAALQQLKDPERDIFCNPLGYRSIQIGLRGEAVHRFILKWMFRESQVMGASIGQR